MSVSATLAADEAVRAARSAGRHVWGLSFGQAGVPVHPLLRDALAAAATRADYGPVAGTPELRAAAAGWWGRRGLPTDADRVVVGPGSKALLYALVSRIGGGLVVPRPSWVSYAAQAALLGVRVHAVPTPPGTGGVPDPDLLAAAVRRARADGTPVRAVVVTVPDNPTGRIAPPDLVRRVCDVARELDLLVIADEVYRDLAHRGDVASPAVAAPERVVTTTGLSKNLALGGWRLGVARVPTGPVGDRLRDGLLATASEIWSGAAQPVQAAAAVAFGEPPGIVEHLARARALYERITLAVAAGFTAVGAPTPAPQAAFYAYPDLGPHRERLRAVHGVRTGRDLADLLLARHGIAVLPGSVFGDPADALTLRVATASLTGADDEQRGRALAARDPLDLPWVAAGLTALRTALAEVTR